MVRELWIVCRSGRCSERRDASVGVRDALGYVVGWTSGSSDCNDGLVLGCNKY